MRRRLLAPNHTRVHNELHVLPFTERLSEAVVPIFVGGAIGAIGLLILRHKGLRWTWALWGGPLAYLVWQLDWQLGLTLTSATVVAAGCGAWWHFEDAGQGGDAAREVRHSIGMWHVIRAYLARRSAAEGRVQMVRRKAHGTQSFENCLAIGVNRRGGVREVPFGTMRGVHALVLGATGSGKTVTQAAIAKEYVHAGLPVIALDPKGDAFLREVLKCAAEHMEVPFREWSPTADTVYNPFGRGNPTEVADKALAGHEWTEPHYELGTQRLLGMVLATMRAAGEWPPTISSIVRNMHPERLDALASRVGGETGERVAEYVDGLSARAIADLGGGRDRLAVLAEGELGPRLDPELGDGPLLDFAHSLARAEVTYMHIDAARPRRCAAAPRTASSATRRGRCRRSKVGNSCDRIWGGLRDYAHRRAAASDVTTLAQ